MSSYLQVVRPHSDVSRKVEGAGQEDDELGEEEEEVDEDDDEVTLDGIVLSIIHYEKNYIHKLIFPLQVNDYKSNLFCSRQNMETVNLMMAVIPRRKVEMMRMSQERSIINNLFGQHIIIILTCSLR